MAFLLGLTLAAVLAAGVAAATPDPLVLYISSLHPVTPYFATLRVDMPTGTAHLEELSTGAGVFVRSPEAWPMMGEHGMMGRPAGQIFRRDEEALSSPELLRKNYTVKLRDGETALGRPTYRLELLPKWSGAIRRTVLLDRDTLVTLRVEDWDHADALVQRQEVTQIDFNPDTRLFTVESPRAASGQADRYVSLGEAAEVLGFRPAQPKYLPPGFSLYGVRLSPAHPGVAHLVFTDGLTIISLFERAVPWWARLGGALSRQSEHGYSLSRGGLAHYLVGDVPPVELQRMLESL